MYTFRKNELIVFREICNQSSSIADIAEVTKIPNISIYRAIQSLSTKRLIISKREGKKLLLLPSPYLHSKALAAYLEGGWRSLHPLVGSRFLVLLSVSSNSKNLDRIAKETKLTSESVRRLVWGLKGFGAITQKEGLISIPKSNTALIRFLRDYSRGASTAILESIAPTGTILWNEGLEFIFSSREIIEASRIRETAITAIIRSGMLFFSDANYYHYAYWSPKLKSEDIALHTILVDPNSMRAISYSLLFLMKEGCNSRYLLGQGEAMGVRELSEQMVRYLAGKTVENPHFPSRSDMANLRAQYEVR